MDAAPNPLSLRSAKDDLKKTNCMDDGRFTPLHNACMSANPGLSESLIEAGAVVEAMTLNGFKPLHFACAANSLPCVDVLVGNGSRVKVSAAWRLQKYKCSLTPPPPPPHHTPHSGANK